MAQKGILLVQKCDTLESANVSQEVGGGAKPVSSSVWHARIGHLPMKALKNLDKCVEGFMMQDSSTVDDCPDETLARGMCD